MRIAIVPGSFDPMTLGHRDIVERALKMFDRVVVAIMRNENKKGRFSYAVRKTAARKTLSGLDAEVTVREGYLADFAKEIGACAIVKGVRNPQDLAYENEMAAFNSARNPDCETVYLPAAEGLADVSSTEVLRRLKAGESTEGLLAPEVRDYLLGRLS